MSCNFKNLETNFHGLCVDVRLFRLNVVIKNKEELLF